MKYNVGDHVRIKSLDWYNKNKDINGNVHCGDKVFDDYMSVFCGSVVTIEGVCYNGYVIRGDMQCRAWTDEMIEGLVEDETKKEDVAWMYDGKLVAERFSDGVTIKVPKYNKLSINTELCDDKIELVISPDFELKQEGNKWFAVKKKKEYPKTYEECCKVMGVNHTNDLDICEHCDYKTEITYYEDSLLEKIETLYRLIICRDAYWKIAGDEMGLGKPWEPDWENKEEEKYTIEYFAGMVHKDHYSSCSRPFAFPTEEMQDTFKKNFDPDIEICKELL